MAGLSCGSALPRDTCRIAPNACPAYKRLSSTRVQESAMPQLSDAIVDRTLECLYCAVADPAAWPAALESISVAFDAPKVAILRATPRMDGVFEMRHLNHEPSAERQYRDYYWSKDPAHRLTRDAPVGAWLNEPHLFDPRTTPEPEYMDLSLIHI